MKQLHSRAQHVKFQGTPQNLEVMDFHLFQWQVWPWFVGHMFHFTYTRSKSRDCSFARTGYQSEVQPIHCFPMCGLNMLECGTVRESYRCLKYLHPAVGLLCHQETPPIPVAPARNQRYSSTNPARWPELQETDTSDSKSKAL